MTRVAPWILALALAAGTLSAPGARAGESLALDLPTTLRLAGARSIEVELAEQELRLARAEARQVRMRFLPWLSTGGAYRRHEGATPDIEGVVLLNADKQLWDVGASAQLDVQVGDSLFAARSSRRMEEAAGHRVDSSHQDAVFLAALRYFDLLAAQARIEVAMEAERTSAGYESEVSRAVEIGLSARSEELRVRVETQKYRIAAERADEDRRMAAARLAEVLRIGGTTDVVANHEDLAPLAVVEASLPLDTLVARAIEGRPELRQSASLLAAARERRNGAVYGPLLPSLAAEAGLGWLGGGPDQGVTRDGDRADYAAGLRWRIGPGGLFDLPRIEAAGAEFHRAELADERLRNAVTREVVEAHARCTSLARRLVSTKDALATTAQSLALARQRREFAVDVVLENIQAEQEQTRARAEYLSTVLDWNRAQYALLRALGGAGTR
jgi:outer membrane protein TolC